MEVKSIIYNTTPDGTKTMTCTYEDKFEVELLKKKIEKQNTIIKWLWQYRKKEIFKSNSPE